MNGFKTFLLMVALMALLMGAGFLIGGYQGVTIALLIGLAINFISYWFSDKIVLSMYRAHRVEINSHPQLYRTIEKLAQRAGLPMPAIYIIPQQQPNAFATGRNPQHAAVAVTTGIMETLSEQELSGVLGHELAHIKNRDILISTIAAAIAAAISYLGYMGLFGGGRHQRRDNAMFGLLLIILGPLAAMLVQMAISRTREYKADRDGAEICGNPEYLASGLGRISGIIKQVPMDANPATAHMFIVNPLRGGGLASLFSTHPPIEKRIEKLRSM
ncbi:MAG: zinc metalloprotease HtpX [Candidatus Scalindua sp. AMX11]|nr:MAG: zinc metalloprotease HtpX [Candidatus Scalindua sp.]RZV80470.1 MAG: zinc metalloprotease HtpX [Candidatus Scalindua sp. SCAELEC01]TDE65308.1 MAG: zinc metalloprotease HtpX [Candidatus Scalindua sp. AMX11]GJQ58523.1 MAG: protease HtpX [Candidatus Scalindua sp.]